MPERAWNSKKIFAANKSAYRAFFSRCPIVCSAPAVVFWGGDHSVLRGGLAVCQTIPLRVYVGLEPVQLRNSLDVSVPAYALEAFGRVYELSDKPVPYFHLAHHDFTHSKKSEELQQLIARRIPIEPVRIHVLSEFSPRMGACWTGAFSAALAGALMVMSGNLRPADIRKWKGKNFRNDPKFKECHLLGWHFSVIGNGGPSSGAQVFCGLAGSKYPICYFTERRLERGKPLINVLEEKDSDFFGSDNDTLKNISYHGFRLQDVAQIRREPHILNGVLTTGVLQETPAILRQDSLIKESLAQTKMDVSKLLKQMNDSLTFFPGFMSDFTEEAPNRHLVDIYHTSLSIASADIFSAVKEVFVRGGGSLSRLADAMLRAHGLLMGFGKSWPLATAVLAEGLHAAKTIGLSDQVGFKLTGVGGGGFLLFVGPKEKGFRDELLRKIGDLSERWRAKADLIWANTVGDLEPDGLRIENCIDWERGRKHFHNDKFGRISSWPHHYLLRLQSGKLDKLWIYPADTRLLRSDSNAAYTLQRKLYVASRPVTSNDLEAIKPTIAMLKALVVRRGSATLHELCNAANKGGQTYDPEDLMHYLRTIFRIFEGRGLGLKIQMSPLSNSLRGESAFQCVIPESDSILYILDSDQRMTKSGMHRSGARRS